MKTALPLLILLIAATASAADPSWAYFGGYTGGRTGGKGIMVSRFDAGKLTDPELAATVGSPSFLCPAPDGKTLYAVGESSGPAPDGGPVYAFRVEKSTGKLTLINSLPSGGNGPCHVAVDPAGEFAVVANYGGGSAALFRLGANGRLVARTAFVQHARPANPKGRQNAPHAHCGRFDPTGRFVLVCDLGLDLVLVYRLDRATGTLTAAMPIILPPGSGPRHMDLTPDGKTLFVNGELNSTVNVIKLDLAGGKSEVAQTLSTLPKPTEGNTTAECRLHPSGKFVYVSNRGHNSIACFTWEAGKLSPIGYATEGIKTPRNFNFDLSGQFLLVANQDGNDVVEFKIGESGLPKPTGVVVKTPAPVCVKFVE